METPATELGRVKQAECGNPPVMYLTAPPSMPLPLNTRFQQRNRSKLQHPLLLSQEHFPLLGLIHMRMEILRWQVKEHFLEEAGDRTRWSVQGAEGSLVLRYAVHLSGLCPRVGKRCKCLTHWLWSQFLMIVSAYTISPLLI